MAGGSGLRMADETPNPAATVEGGQAASLSGCAPKAAATSEGTLSPETGRMPVPLPDDELLSPAPRTDRVDRLAFVAASLVAFAVYLLSLSPNVNLGDSGVLTTSAFYGGVAGPPGQPVWTLYSWVFTKILPFSNIAWRVAVGSAVAGALLCGFVAMIISYGANAIFKDSKFIEKLTCPDWDKLRIGGGVAASLVLGFNGLFWSQAVQVEISSLSYLIFTIILWLLTRVSFYSGGRGMLCLAFFVFGLLLTSSQELLIALPGFTCLVMFSRPGHSKRMECQSLVGRLLHATELADDSRVYRRPVWGRRRHHHHTRTGLTLEIGSSRRLRFD